jgi:nicotinamidase/pyrazinamidase
MADPIIVMCPQNSFFDPKGSIYTGEKSDVLKIRLIDYLKGYQGKKIYFREKHAEIDTFFANDVTHSIVNSFDYKICDGFTPFADLIYDKTRYSGFFNTELDIFLRKDNVKSVCLVGIETHISILYTAEELRNRNVDVTIIEPLTASRDDYMHNVAMSLMINSLGVNYV